MIPLDILTIYSPSIALTLRNVFPINIHQNFSWTKQIFQTKKHISWISIWKWYSYVRVPQSQWFHLSSISPWVSGDVPNLPSYGIYISQLVTFDRCCNSVLYFNSKNLQITWYLLTQVTGITSFEKHWESSSSHTLSFCPNLVKFRFKNISKGISHLVFHCDLVYKQGKVNG